MKPLNLFKYIIFIMLIALILSCRKNPAIYQMPNDPRAYTWTVDTLLFYQHNIGWATTLNRLWGSSPNDVYAVGLCTSAGGRMYHFNGEKWQYSKKVRVIGQNGPYSITNIFGFSSDDIWAVGYQDPGDIYEDLYQNLIMHYNGVEWNKVYGSEPDTMYRELTSIWGSSPDDIWFGGCWGDMYHWDGQTVTQDTMPFDVKDYMAENSMVAEFHSITGYPGKGIYAIFFGTKGDIDYLMQHTDKGWVFRDSLNSYVDLWMSPQD